MYDKLDRLYTTLNQPTALKAKGPITLRGEARIMGRDDRGQPKFCVHGPQ